MNLFVTIPNHSTRARFQCFGKKVTFFYLPRRRVSQPTGRVAVDFQWVVELFPRNTKYCFNGRNIEYFVIRIDIYSNMYILNILFVFFVERRKLNWCKETTKWVCFSSTTQKLQVVVKNGSWSDFGWETLL